MVRKTFKRSSLFVLIAIIALLGLGVGYATNWAQTLTINGSIDTADFAVVWTGGSSSGATGPMSCSVAVDPADPTGKTLTVTVHDAYPGGTCNVVGTISNQGELTAYKVAGPTVSGDGAGFVTSASCPSSIAPSDSAQCSFTVGVDDSAPEDDDGDTFSEFTFAIGVTYDVAP